MEQILFTQSSNELRSASMDQSRISQLMLEMQLVNINLKYKAATVQDRLKINALNSEIYTLESQRNLHISNAIRYALDLAEYEIHNAKNIVISMSYMAISSINSFIRAQNIKFELSFPLKMKVSQISNMLIMPDLIFLNLKSEIDKLSYLPVAY